MVFILYQIKLNLFRATLSDSGTDSFNIRFSEGDQIIDRPNKVLSQGPFSYKPRLRFLRRTSLLLLSKSKSSKFRTGLTLAGFNDPCIGLLFLDFISFPAFLVLEPIRVTLDLKVEFVYLKRSTCVRVRSENF